MTTATAQKSEAYVESANAEEVFDKVTQLLTDANHPNPSAWVNDLVKTMGEQVKQEQAPVARVAVNSYWAHKLGMLGINKRIDTANERFCLEDRCSEKEWHELMKKIVTPTIAAHAL